MAGTMDDYSVLSTKIDNVQKTLDDIKSSMNCYEDKNNKSHSEFYARIGKLEIGFGKLQVWTAGAIFIGGLIVGALIQKFI